MMRVTPVTSSKPNPASGRHRLSTPCRMCDQVHASLGDSPNLLLIDVVGELGTDRVYLRQPDVEGLPGQVTVRIDTRRRHQRGEMVRVTTDPQHVHVFGTESGARLSDRGGPRVTGPWTDGARSALVRRAAALVSGHERRILGIAGPPGAGKSTLTEALLEHLRADPPHGLGPDAVAHLPMDGFHLADNQLDRLGIRDRKGAPETFDVDGYVATLERVLRPAGRTVYAPGFERELEQPIAAAVALEPSARLVVTEGNYLLLAEEGWERVRPLLAEVWYVDTDPAIRVRRLVARHERFGKSPTVAREWVERSDEANARRVAATRAAADLVVDIDRD